MSPKGIGRISTTGTVPVCLSATVTGTCAVTRPEAVPTTAMITANPARLPGRRAAPLICGSARKPSGESGLLPVTIFIIAGARRRHC
jgi:hypothetical protein